MDYGIPDINLEALPYTFAIVAGLVYAFLYFKHFTKGESGYYGIVFSALRGIAVAPFWGFILVLSYYIYSPHFRELINLEKEIIPTKSITIENDLPDTKHFFILLANPDSTEKNNETHYYEKWRFAKLDTKYYFFPNFAVKPYAEKKVIFQCPTNVKKLYLQIINESGENWKIGAAAQIYDINNKNLYIQTSDLDKSRIKKIRPSLEEKTIYYLMFYSLAVLALLYHILHLHRQTVSAKGIKLGILYTFLIMILWMEFNFGIQKILILF